MRKPIYPELEYTNVTERDLELSAIYFPILTDIAKTAGLTITYGDLLKEARRRHPDQFLDADGNVRETDFSTGRRLGAIWRFTHRQGYPILSALVVNASTGECGRGVTELVDPVAERERVYAFDWDQVADEFLAHRNYEREQHRLAARPGAGTRTREEAAKLLWKYWNSTQDLWPSEVRNHRDTILSAIEEGADPAVAFTDWYLSAPRMSRRPSNFLYVAEYRNAITGNPLREIDAVKIGQTNNLGRRQQELSGGAIGPVQVVFTRAWDIATGDASVLEQRLHGVFKYRNLVGEWFEGLGGAMVELIDEHLAGLDFEGLSAEDIEPVSLPTT